VYSQSINLVYLAIDLSRGWMGAEVGRVGQGLCGWHKGPTRRGQRGWCGGLGLLGETFGVCVECAEPVCSCRSVSKKRMTGESFGWFYCAVLAVLVYACYLELRRWDCQVHGRMA
jgi:hypothetical protein